ncbi:MAG: NADH-quinone oxidoreductase subunit C, partial [Chloroflexi bacterium]|nr:NADH-quinone oxidoreductase subunit C [Chloroflexota bacterium]
MTDFSRLRAALADNLQGRATNIRVRRDNELHFQIVRGDVLCLAEFLRAGFGAELILMVANDRRADKGVFEVHYLFANDRESWFAHATKDVPVDDPIITSLATFYYPASRFEREIEDTFGIKAVAHPDYRPLVRHAFWPEDYFPL